MAQETVDLRKVYTTNTREILQTIKSKLATTGSLRVLTLDPHVPLLVERELSPAYRVQVEAVRPVKTVDHYVILIQGA
ncbi:MAG: hypothetical protein HY675_27525 [Chloroflexi bacterium]|nr:hypothetical protein [Chloroflexota bacterium]